MKIRTLSALLWAVQLLLPALPAAAVVYPGRDEVVGSSRNRVVRPGESLMEIARRFGLGYNEIVAANPGLDPFVPPVGRPVLLATRRVVPERPEKGGIVINLSEMRLYHFLTRKGTSLVATFAVGIGSEGNDTPLGCFRVVEKRASPSWHVPASIRKEHPLLPAIVPPGPDNPLGSHALRLSLGDLLIHGTNRPWGVGRRASHGCIRLYPEDIPRLFGLAAIGTSVTIVRQPVKLGVKGGRLFLEVHRDPVATVDYLEEAIALLAKRQLLLRFSRAKLWQAISEKRGVPVDITA
jgi:L,D-transpeptidase ErfK/SrfK